MIKDSKRAIVAINILAIFMLICLFSLGCFARSVAQTPAQGSPTNYDQLMKSRVGKTYTEKQHASVCETLESADKMSGSLAKSLFSISKITLQISGIAALILMLNTFLIIKGYPNKNRVNTSVN